MNENHYQHLNYIAQEAVNRLSEKYQEGVAEHDGTHLRDDYSIEQLLDCAIDEAVDQLSYLLTLKQKINGNPGTRTPTEQS